MDTLRVTLAVPDLTGREGASTIEALLQTAHGVSGARADIAANRITVAFDPDSIDVIGIVLALQQRGYDVAGLIPNPARRGSAAITSRPVLDQQRLSRPTGRAALRPGVRAPAGGEERG